MPVTDDERRREYPGERFARRIIDQDLDEVARKLRDEEFGEGHMEQGHNQIELYRHNRTTISFFVFDEGGHLPEHVIEDGAVMIHVLDGKFCLQADDSEKHVHHEDDNVLILEPGVSHSVQAEVPGRLLVSIMRD